MDWLTILPQILTIAIVLWKKDIILGLLSGLFISETLILIKDGDFLPLAGAPETIERIVSTFNSASNIRLFMFTILIGALIAFLKHSGGVAALVKMLVEKGYAKSKKRTGLITMLVGIMLFMETSLSMLTTGLLSRGLFDKFGMSRERLAYLVDVTCAPVSILFIVVNGWGAYVIGTLSTSGLDDPLSAVIGSIAFNFYPWLALIIALYTVLSDKTHGPLKKYEAKAAEQVGQEEGIPEGKASHMIIPLLVMVGGIFSILYMTGNGNISNGDGSRAILYATILATGVAYILMYRTGRFTHSGMIKIANEGMQKLVNLLIILVLALAFGASLKVLGTGDFIAGIVGKNLPLITVVPIIFLTASFVSFSTGTSYGTMALFIPIGVPIIQQLGLDPAFVLSAILGGAVFGDHCSPISDTTVLSSVASGCDVLDHVETQLPYALVAGGGAFILYFIAGFFVL
ncbi:sodium:proton antiporter [Kordiimonas sp. SCSIO 12603]|uniref:Na+/H+ antiporter NhaC family protein n=1 Tax=Kordiimonas sp. SCSIO 12603 TaxID=2829596 RepID=UPI002102CCC3|nr:Na+/H+ antiporter NhaC family protein [Kordiimonas sp. SCSIO 12603]UTW59500.1 sodium:proton antiporter [Kordiimonas sp. SCSIO 12603]